ncbi:hypothetical protein R6Q57_028640 [Mikania cordata]
MRQNARKLKPNPSNNQRRNIRSSSIRDIIGDRRFHNQFSRGNTNHTEVCCTMKVKRLKVSYGSSNQSENTKDPRGCFGDFAAKTSEYAFFKRMKENTYSNVHVHPNDHDNQFSNVQQSHHFTSEEIPNVPKEGIEYVGSSLPNEKEQNETKYSFLSPPCGESKKPFGDNVFGADGPDAQNVRHDEYNWLSPSLGSKIKTSGNNGVFSAKREKLRNLAADRCLYNTDELSSKGDPNQDEHDSKCKLPPLFESEFKSLEAYKRKLIELQNIPYLDDCLSRPAKKPIDQDLLEWNPTGSEYFSCGLSPNFRAQYNRCQTESYKREFIKSHHISYMEDCFSRSTKEPIDMDIMEWNPTGLESNIQYNHHHMAGSFRIHNFGMDRISSFDDPLLIHKSRNFPELDEYNLYDEPKLLEQPHTLLLGWDHNSEKDESFLASSSTSSQPSPYITRHLQEQHLLTSSASPYTQKHLMAAEDCNIKFPLQDYNTWHMNESLIEKEHRCSESILYLIQSPADKSLSFQNAGLRLLVADDEDRDNFVCDSDRLLKGRVNDYRESFLDKDFDQFDYPLLLHDSSKNDEFL